VPVLVNGTTYDVTYFEGSYDDNTSRFTTAEMPWWGDAILAKAFAAAVGGQLGQPTFSALGPGFAYNIYLGGTLSFLDAYAFDANASDPVGQGFTTDQNIPYAIATSQTTASVPAPLPILGAAAAFGATKRLRTMSRRLHRSTTAGS
jgi:hypothetical protein